MLVTMDHEAQLKQDFSEYMKMLGNTVTQITQGMNDLILRGENMERMDKEVKDYLEETLTTLRINYPELSVANCLQDFKSKLNTIVEQRRIKRDNLQETKQQMAATKHDLSTETNKIKRDINLLNTSNHELEDRIRRDQENIPTIIRIMSSKQSVPKIEISTPTETIPIADYQDSVAQHIEAMLDRLEDR